MASSNKNTARLNIGVFIAILALCLVAPSGVKNFVSDMFGEFRAPFDILPSHLRDLQKYWSLSSHSKRDLIEAGRDLARLNAALELRVLENETLRSRIKRYEDIFSIPPAGMYKQHVARVARRVLNAWWQQLVIRKGSIDGIKEGCAVIYGGGVVGRIKEVGLFTSVVELVSSRNFRMAAVFEGDDRPVIYQGVGQVSFGEGCGEVVDVYADMTASASKPRKLVASSIAGVFPEGLPIGTVSNLTLNYDGIFKTGRVVLSTDLSALNEVLVLVPIEAEQKK